MAIRFHDFGQDVKYRKFRKKNDHIILYHNYNDNNHNCNDMVLYFNMFGVCTYLASVFPLFTTRAQESVVQLEIVAKTGLLQLRFALAVRNYRNVYFLLKKIIKMSVD